MVLNKWKYGVFDVSNVRCLNCQKTFKIYFKKNVFSHIIINEWRSKRTIIITYLKKHDSRNILEIAKDTNIPAIEVEKILNQLAYKGVVEILNESSSKTASK